METTFDLGPVKSLMDDPQVSEIMVNGAGKIFAEKNGKKSLTDARFSSEEELVAFVQKIYERFGKRVSKYVPYADVCMDDGTRINAIIPPMSRFGTSLTFRKFSKDIRMLEDLIRNETITERAAEFLIACIKGKVNIIFSGGTSTGKTTLLQMLSRYFGEGERVITIEDAAELKLDQENLISLETRVPDETEKGEVTLRDLIRNSLRMSPDRLVIGEVRGAEAIDLLQAMATGHKGAIGVIHGNSPKDIVSRLETMVLMSGIQLPLWQVRKIIASTINLIVHHERLQDGSRKVTYITEVRGLEKEEVILNDLFTFNLEKVDENGKVIGKLKPSLRYYPLFYQRFRKMGLLDDKTFVSE
ncbi:MAG: ATPase, T2SS/T4P/T4SS family [Candidatus Omnitrophica bacterium]|nr:ATPase, T2SS/T4P/T4SS family [Candidatus Omnitrophota bacterium]